MLQGTSLPSAGKATAGPAVGNLRLGLGELWTPGCVLAVVFHQPYGDSGQPRHTFSRLGTEL